MSAARTEGAEMHERRLAAARWWRVRHLCQRWDVGRKTVYAIPRASLPYIEYGDSKQRRYDPRDVEQYEQAAKRGEVAA